VFIFSVII